MSLVLKTAPTVEPLSLLEVKDHLRLDPDDNIEDALLNAFITAARQDCEAFQGRAYITQTWELWLDAFPGEAFIRLDKPPLQSRTITAGAFVVGKEYRILSIGTTDFTLIGAASNTVGVHFTATGVGSGTGTATDGPFIKYYDTDDTEATFAASNYFVDTKSEPGRVALNYSAAWPSTTLRPVNGVCVIFVAGYGDAAANVPQYIKSAILLLIGHWYENREGAAIPSAIPKEIPFGVEALLWKERVF